MKKASLVIVTLTLLSCAFAAGFFLGRNTGRNTISISSAPTTKPTFSTQPQTTDAVVTEAYPIDINTATVEELITLPGIGEVLARRIVAYREANGPFESVAQLCNVEGIADKKLENILDYITIGGQG